MTQVKPERRAKRNFFIFEIIKPTGQRPITVQYLLPYDFGCKQIEPDMEVITHVPVCASKRDKQTISLSLPLRF